MAEFIGRNGKAWSCEERPVVSSIFDTNWAGQIDTNGKYWCILTDHKTHENYCVDRQVFHDLYMSGHSIVSGLKGRCYLDYGETTVFNGEEVRGLSSDEEQDYNMERCIGLQDLWGNLSTNAKELTVLLKDIILVMDILNN